MKQLMLLLLATMTIQATAQRKNVEEFYLWDADFKPVSKQEFAAFFTSVMKVNDTCWQWDTFNITGPMISSEHF